MVRGAQQLGERLGPAVGHHGHADLVAGCVPTESGARCIRASDLRPLADEAHVAVRPGLRLLVHNGNPVEQLEIGNPRDLERDPGQLAGFPFGDAGSTCVPLANGAASAGFDAGPPSQVGQLCRELSRAGRWVSRLVHVHQPGHQGLNGSGVGSGSHSLQLKLGASQVVDVGRKAFEDFAAVQDHASVFGAGRRIDLAAGNAHFQQRPGHSLHDVWGG